MCLSRQTCLLRQNTSFVTTKVFLLQQNYVCVVVTKVVSRQAYFCHSRSNLVMTKVLSQQNYVCCDKSFVTTKICFVATKMIPVSAPTNDSLQGHRKESEK